MKKSNIFYGLSLGLAFTAIGFSCAKNNDETPASERYLYVASGTCNSGQGITTFSGVTSSRIVSKIGLTSKNIDVFVDLGAEYTGGFLRPETTAQSLIDNGSSILMLTENPTGTGTGDRQIWNVPKSSPFNMVSFASDSNAFTNNAAHILRSMARDSNDEILFSKSVAIEKLGINNLQVSQAGPAPWISNPAGTCATSVTNITSIAIMPPFTGATEGKVIYAHQGAAAADNRLGIIRRTGVTAAAGCIEGQTISSATHTPDAAQAFPTTLNAAGASPTAIVYIPTPSGPTAGKLLVAYAPATSAELDNSTNLNNAIVMYDVTETSDTAATISDNPTILYASGTVIFGISAMAYDSTDNSLYVATASQQGIANQTTQAYGYKIEKFRLNLGGSPQLTLIRDTSVSPPKPFIERNSLTKCITSMSVGS